MPLVHSSRIQPPIFCVESWVDTTTPPTHEGSQNCIPADPDKLADIIQQDLFSLQQSNQ